MDQSPQLRIALFAVGMYLLYRAIGSETAGEIVAKAGERAAAAKAMPMDFRSVFVRKIYLDADNVAKSVGWPRDLLITVAAHESNWGRSGLTEKANNLFGFKVNASWLAAGKPFIELPTWEVFDGVGQTIKAKFRAYPSWAESIRDYVVLITSASRYREAASAAQAKDFAGYFEAVKRGGYATDPSYPEKLAKSFEAVLAAVV